MEFKRNMSSGCLEKWVRNCGKDLDLSIRHWRSLWRLWKLHCEFDLSAPNRSEWSWDFTRGSIPNCSNCTENCCKGPTNTVLLRLVDVARLLDRGLERYMTTEKPVFSEELLRERPRLREMIGSFHWKVFPVLKQDQSGKCTLLSKDGRCTIHHDRPWVCRTFPYVLDVSNRRVHWSSRCPHPNVQSPAQKEAKELEQAIFLNFYQEKIRDLILINVHRETIERSALAQWLCFDHK